jgi:hypothetical protein
MSIVGVAMNGDTPTVIIGRDELEARRVSTGPMALSKFHLSSHLLLSSMPGSLYRFATSFTTYIGT